MDPSYGDDTVLSLALLTLPSSLGYVFVSGGLSLLVRYLAPWAGKQVHKMVVPRSRASRRKHPLFLLLTGWGKRLWNRKRDVALATGRGLGFGGIR